MMLWIVRGWEPLPGEGGRLMRSALLAERVAANGDRVVWWTTNFDHVRKTHRFPGHRRLAIRPGYTIECVPSRGYSKNVSLARILDDATLAKNTAALMAACEKPDVMLCSMPALLTPRAAAAYARKNGIPFVLDIRDLWPDIFEERIPAWLRAPASLAIEPLHATLRNLVKHATAISGITDRMVDWALQKADRKRTELDRAFPHGYSLKGVRPEDRAAATERLAVLGILEHGKFVCIYIGSISERATSEMRTVIEAARILEKKNPSVLFCICGAGAADERLVKYAQGCRNVCFTGWLDSAGIQVLLKAAHAGLVPYPDRLDFRMSIPNKVLEYLAGGVPVISSLSGTTSALLERENCGLTYREGDAAGLARMAGDLEQAPGIRQRMAANARAAFERYFTAEKVYGAFADHLTEIAAQGSQNTSVCNHSHSRDGGHSSVPAVPAV